MNSGTITIVTPVEHALGLVEIAVAELITTLRDGGLDHHDQAGLLTLLDRAEVVRNQWQAVDAELLAACRDREIAERECQRSMAKVLERRCLVTPGEARRRMLAAEAAGPRQTPTGIPLPRLRDHVSSAMRAGSISSQQVTVVDETLGKLDRADVHPDQVKEVEAELVQHCRQFAPKELKTLCQRYLDALDPDGPEPDEQRNRDRRSWRMHATPSGAVVGEFRLTPATGAKLRAILSSLSNPRVDTVGGLATADLRTHEQRLHDAVDDLCSRVLRVGGLPDSGGTPATVIVTIDQTDLLEDLARAGLYKPTSQTDARAPFGFCPTCGQGSATARRAGSDDHAQNGRPNGSRSPNPTGDSPGRVNGASSESRGGVTGAHSGSPRNTSRTDSRSPRSASGTECRSASNPNGIDRHGARDASGTHTHRGTSGTDSRGGASAAGRAGSVHSDDASRAGSERAGHVSKSDSGTKGRATGNREDSEVGASRHQESGTHVPSHEKCEDSAERPQNSGLGASASDCTSQGPVNRRSELDQTPVPATGSPGRVRRSRPRHGITSDGIPLTVHELLALAGEAEIYPIVLTKHGLLLEMGRERRIANKHQTLALIARDGGCSFPGCDHPPEWCERHHVVPWLHNGPTDLKNLTLLCSYHHHHFLDRGWQVRINADGLPEWIPPRYIDPDQQPMINNRIIARIHQGPLFT